MTPPSPNLLRRVTRWRLYLSVGLLLAVVGSIVVYVGHRRRERAARPPVFTAIRGPLPITLIASGTLKSREQLVIRSNVEGRNTIVWLIEEGRQVKQGDLLVELDSSTFRTQATEQEIKVLNAEANLIQARENLEVVRNQAEANIEEAELNLRFARMDAEKHEKGDQPQLLRQSDAEITIATEELQRAQEQLQWTRRLAEEGYVTRTELQADELALKRRELDLELARNRRELLTQYTLVQTGERLRSNIKQAEMALERVRRKARADLVRAESELRAREAEYNQQLARLNHIKEQIERCRITAPADGLVVYATTIRPQRWGSQQPLAVGQDVSERTELIYLPLTSAMMAEIRVPEASLTKIRPGLSAEVRVDACPGRVFPGQLSRIGVLPDSEQSWMNPDLKLYVCEVHLLDGSEDLRPGMSCQVEIFVHRYEDVVQVPVQCVLRVDGHPTVWVSGRRGSALPRPVTAGLDNNRMIAILEGLQAGEQVLLAPPLTPAARSPLSAEMPRSTAETLSAGPTAASNRTETAFSSPAASSPEERGPRLMTPRPPTNLPFAPPVSGEHPRRRGDRFPPPPASGEGPRP